MSKKSQEKAAKAENIDLSLISKEELHELEIQAADIVASERKEQAKKAALNAAIAKEKRKYNPSEKMENIVLNLAEHSAFLRIDDVFYFHGKQYTVPHSLAQVMRETEARGWKHQEEIDGKKGNPYQRLRNMSLSGATGAVTSA